MSSHDNDDDTDTDNDTDRPDRRSLPPAAIRALAEAEERREARQQRDLPAELGGRTDGLDPVRYGDWEINGRAIDF